MRAYAQETNRLNRERRTSGEATCRALVDTEKAIAEIVRVIERGGYHRALSARLTELEGKQDDLSARLSEVPVDLPDIHPNIGDLYRRRIERLTEALNLPTTPARLRRRYAKSSTGSSLPPARSAATSGSPCTAISTPRRMGRAHRQTRLQG